MHNAEMAARNLAEAVEDYNRLQAEGGLDSDEKYALELKLKGAQVQATLAVFEAIKFPNRKAPKIENVTAASPGDVGAILRNGRPASSTYAKTSENVEAIQRQRGNNEEVEKFILSHGYRAALNSNGDLGFIDLNNQYHQIDEGEWFVNPPHSQPRVYTDSHFRSQYTHVTTHDK